MGLFVIALVQRFYFNVSTVKHIIVVLTSKNCRVGLLPFFFKEKSGGKTEENGDRKTPNSDKSSRSSSPAQSTKSSSSAPSTPQDNKVVTFPPPKVTADSVRGKCREMFVSSLKVEVEFEQSMWIHPLQFLHFNLKNGYY